MAHTYLDEDFTDIDADWTNGSVAPNTATEGSGSGKNYVVLYSGATSGFPNSANITRTLTEVLPDKFTMEFSLWHVKLGTAANYDTFGLTVAGKTFASIVCSSNNVSVCNTSIGDWAIHNNTVWQTWRLEVKNLSVWVFLDDVFIQRVETISYGTAGLVTAYQLGWSAATGMKTFIDYLTITSSGGIAKSLIF